MNRNLDRFPDHTLSTYALVRDLARLGRYPEAELYLNRREATDAGWAFYAKLTMGAIRGDLPVGGNELAHAFADAHANNTTVSSALPS
jgi:hypothetical protein